MEQKGCWGYLVPCPVESPPIELHKTEVLAGRDASCDILLQGSLLGCKQENISKHHFRLVHGAQGTVLKDESRSGTFVNDRLVGRDKQEAISHGARIDIIHRGIKAFVFLDRAVSDNGNHPKSIKDKFVMGNLLGEGNFGTVFLVLDKAALKRYAMKMVKNSQVAKREAQILCEIRHPCMIRAYEIFANLDHLYLVMEYIGGGDLSHWVNDKKLLSEKQTKLLFYQLALAVQYMHQNSITHRDLKPANILLVASSPHTLIKVTDFGLAKDENLHSKMTTCLGTELYLAPEVLASPPYTNKVDIWSMGVILYYSLIGMLPFHTFSEARRLRHKVKFVAEEWTPISLTALELVKRMLVTSPQRRANVNEVLASLWLQDEPMKEDAHSLMGSHVAQSPASPKDQKLLSPTNRNTPQVVRNSVSPTRPKAVSPAKVTAVSPPRINVVPPERLNIPSPSDKSPTPTPQYRTPVSPRGVLQYPKPSSGADKTKATNPPILQSPNRLTARSPASPQRRRSSPAAVNLYKPGVSPAKVTAVSPPRINVVSAERLNIPSPSDKSPTPTPQYRTPVSPRGVLQYPKSSSGADKTKATNPPILQSNRLTVRSPASPQRRGSSPAAVNLDKPGQSAEGVGIKLTVEHRAEKTFLVEARRNLTAAPRKP